MIHIIRDKSIYQKLKSHLSSFKLVSFLSFFALVIGVTLFLTTKQQDVRQRASDSILHKWGQIANAELTGQSTKGVFLFAGPPNPNSLPLYTRNPIDSSSFNWGSDQDIDRVFDAIQQVGANVIKLSWWGTGTEYQQYAPTFNSIAVNNQVFTKAKTRNIMVAPLIEVSTSFKFYEDFPTNTSILENDIKHLLSQYGQNSNWLQLYDKNGQGRKVIWLIETIHLGAVDKSLFASAFDTVANKIETDTGQKIGFIIDPTPLPPNGSYEGPDPILLSSTRSLLAINPFNITSDGNTEAERLLKAEDILKKWNMSGIPLIAPVLPGYDDHIVRPPGQVYGDNTSWRDAVESLAKKYQTAGISLDVWNGFTEGYAFAPTIQNQSENYNLAKRLFSYITASNQPTLAPSVAPAPYFENQYIRIWDSRVFPGIIDLFYKDSSGNWQQYNNIVPIARVGGVWGNAELDKAVITREVVTSTPQQQVVKYQFAPLSNRAHFYLLMTLNSEQKEVQFQVKLNPDSAPVEALALGNYYGYATLIRYLKINNTTYDALTYPKPDPDGIYTLGRFTRYEYPTNNRIEFWGENGLRQYQYVDVPLAPQDEMVSEVRFTPWLPEQPSPGKNWFETVHITRSPFTEDKSVWHFGYELPGITSTPTPFFTPPPPTATPTFQPTPTPSKIPTPTPTLIPTSTPFPTPTKTPTPIPTTTQSTGFTGEYYNNTNLVGTPVLVRNDNAINFKWGSSSPDPKINSNIFSVRWSKSQNFSNGYYKFTVSNDDGMRIYLDGVNIYNSWRDQSALTRTFIVRIFQGLHNVVVQYYENKGNASAYVRWARY